MMMKESELMILNEIDTSSEELMIHNESDTSIEQQQVKSLSTVPKKRKKPKANEKAKRAKVRILHSLQ